MYQAHIDFSCQNKCINQSIKLNISLPKMGVTLSNLINIFFDSYSANTRSINVTTLQNTLFVAPQHIQFTAHYCDF